MASARKASRRLSKRKIKNLKALARKIDRDESASIRSSAQVAFARHQQMRSIVESLKARRLQLRISLATIARRSGIATPNLSRLENAIHAAPTLDTLERYAQAIGMAIRVELTDANAA